MLELSILTVTMNHLHQVKDLLYALYHEAKPTLSFEVIIVDNCSTDGTVDFIKTHYPQVKIVVNKKVCGFSHNNNEAFKHATAPNIAIINPDIIPQPNSFDSIVKFLNTNNEVGIAVPQLLNTDGSVQHSIRRFINLKLLFLRIIHWGNDQSANKKIEEYLLKNIDLSKVQPIDWALGAALFMKREMFERLKGFDERFFLYVEDEDLCLRCWKLGKTVLYVPDSKMIHAHNRSSAKGINKKTLFHARSMAYFIVKHKLFLRSYTFMQSTSK